MFWFFDEFEVLSSSSFQSRSWTGSVLGVSYLVLFSMAFPINHCQGFSIVNACPSHSILFSCTMYFWNKIRTDFLVTLKREFYCLTALSAKETFLCTSDRCDRSSQYLQRSSPSTAAHRSSGQSLIGSTDRPLQPRFFLHRNKIFCCDPHFLWRIQILW